jgi:hypothetical protein
MSNTLYRGVVAAAAGTAFLLAAASAAAETGQRADLTVRLTSQLPGSSTGMTLAALYKAPGDPDAKPPAITSVVLEGPVGLRFNSAALPRCDASDAELRAMGTSACPAQSKLGQGTFTAITGFGPPIDPFVGDTHVFNAPDQLLEVITFKDTDRTAGFDRLTIKGSTISGYPPSTPGGPPDGQTTVRSIDFAIPARGAGKTAYLTTPPTCPAGGTWATRGTFGFADGGTETVTSLTPCRRPAPSGRPPTRPKPAPRQLGLSVSPRAVLAGQRTRFTFRARSAEERCARGALVRFAGRKAVTDGRGRAALTTRLMRPGRRAATVTKAGCRGRSAWVLVRGG